MIKVTMLWLVNEYGELLLARRADHKTQDPSLWGPSVTGKLEEGETFVQALVREAEEELALKPHDYVPEFLFETEFPHPDGETRQFGVFVARVPKDTELQIDKNEVAEVTWLTISKIKELLHSKPGEVVVASAFVLWDQIFKSLENSAWFKP